MENVLIQPVDPNDPAMKDDVEVPSYASSTDLYERNRLEMANEQAFSESQQEVWFYIL